MNKVKGPGGISAKFAKMLANVIDCHLFNIINNDLSLTFLVTFKQIFETC